jgi:2-polyprenyl-6-methoxyphenol hydroxylase-like FAD-dependent oxidoreductase
VVLARAFAPSRMTGDLRRMDGTLIKRLDLPVAALLGGTLAIALRPALHGALLDAVGPDSISVNHEAISFTQNHDRVAVRFRHGEVIEGDLLVGADGFGSVVRRTLHPAEPPPRPSGLVAVRGAVHGVVHHLHDDAAVYYVDAGVESVIVRASDTGIYWFMSLAQELVPRGMTDPAAVLAHMTPRFDATFSAVTSATDDLRFDELFDRNPLPFWSRGAVTTIGDAAHPLLPHTGQGAAQAIVDGVTLGRVLAGGADVANGLRQYEAERRDTTIALLRRGRRTAGLMRMTNPIGCAMREAAVRMIPADLMIRMFERINRRRRG